jgi:hypothetical protein
MEDEVMGRISNNLHSYWMSAPFAPHFKRIMKLLSKLNDHSIPNVRKWTIEELKWAKSNYENALMEDAEEL